MRRSEILAFVTNYVQNAASRLSTQRYSQENAYVNAFLGKLDGPINLGETNGEIDLRCTIVNSNGPGAAERKFGADFALCFESTGIKNPIKKAVISQAKRGNIDTIPSSEKKRLKNQCAMMAAHTQHYFCLETPTSDGEIPYIRIGKNALGDLNDERIRFDVYLVDYIISCTHGDKRHDFIDAVSYSNLTKLEVVSDGLTFEPDFSPNEPSFDF